VLLGPLSFSTFRSSAERRVLAAAVTSTSSTRTSRSTTLLRAEHRGAGVVAFVDALAAPRMRDELGVRAEGGAGRARGSRARRVLHGP
jgi:hypothetical protein